MSHVIASPFLATGSPETSVETTPYAPGDVGGIAVINGKTYQKVRVFDPVAAAAAAAAAEKAEEEKKKLEEPPKEEPPKSVHKSDVKEPVKPPVHGKEAEGKAKPAPKTPAPIEAGQLAFWQDAATYVVTNDPSVATAGAPSGSKPVVAGVFGGPVPPGSYCWITQKGRGVKVKCATASAGQSLMAGDSGEATGGEAPKPAPLGVVTEPPVDGLCTASLNIEPA